MGANNMDLPFQPMFKDKRKLKTAFIYTPICNAINMIAINTISLLTF